MGNAKIWWYPDPAGTVEEIDLGEPLSELVDNGVTPEQIGARTMTGREFVTQTLARTPVLVALERFETPSVYRDLQHLAEHLRRGGTCAVAADADKAWASYLAIMPDRGDTQVTAGDTPWSALNPSAAVTAGDEVMLETGQPYVRRELRRVTAVSGSTYTLGVAGVRDSYLEEPWVLMRHRGFYPVLRLPIEQRSAPILTTERWVTHTFRAQLEVSPNAYALFSILGGSIIGDSLTDGEQTIDQVLLRDEGSGGPVLGSVPRTWGL